MSATIEIEARELDHRSNDGIEVTLMWSRRGNRVWIAVTDDRRGDAFELDVDPADALNAFHHPYAYAPTLSDRSQPTALDRV